MTSDPRTLARFSVSREGGAYRLAFEDGAGATVSFLATEEQLDVLADLIDDALGTASDD